MNEFKGKRLLVLGGGHASLPIVRIAKEEGAYVIVTDYLKSGVAKEIADEALVVSTADIDALAEIVKEKKIDGVFSGPSEFNIVNVMKLCKKTGLPFYATGEQWDICSDKALFKQMCRDSGVPCVPEYHVTQEFLKEDLETIKYPVIVKPVDSSSSRGITVVQSKEELIPAYQEALSFSKKGHVIVEKYINNDFVFSVKYVAYNGEIQLLLTSDSYIVDPIGRTALIANVTVFPSKLYKQYIQTVDPAVKKMFKTLGIQNGAFFMQALVNQEDGNIYFHEMGLRLSGGYTYTVTEPVTGISDAKMMIRYALGLGLSSPEEIERIDPTLKGQFAVSVCVPLKPGVIAHIEGVEACRSNLNMVGFLQYYHEGDEITTSKVGTIDQHFCRIKLLCHDYTEIEKSINFIMENIKVIDVNGKDMLFKRFDTTRLE
ncbi:MAG: ATP-grasp domain-containing protein [Clostridia bacterium]|nr:ATP-grasp domain-containing protein [Clostridia bacterium]